MKLIGGCLWVLAGFVCLISAQDGPVVVTSLGKVRGSIMQSAKGRSFSAFRGIRYAQPPVGRLRFKEPVAVTTWGDALLDATKDGYICPQPRFPENIISEDCLILNVYSGNLTGNASVLVYIHGGGNIVGSSHSQIQSGPGFLMDHEIVVVSMNYRLGALGFLSTGTKEAPGNYAYLDQLMALRWVRDHISGFGGNPNSVTIFGLSAGAMAVTLHLASPLSAGLFHRAIAMSGSTTSHFEFDNAAMARKLARQLSCPQYNASAIVECLRLVEWSNITKYLSSWEPYGVPSPLWFYEVDNHFLLDKPTNLFANGSFNKVPVLTGVTRDEFAHLAYYFDQKVLSDINENFDKYAPEFFTFELEPANTAKEKSERIRKFYLNNSRIDEQLGSFGNIFADAAIGHGVYRLMELARKHVNVFYYRDDYQGRFGLNTKANVIGHGDDLQYIFDSSFYGGRIKVGDPEWFMVERMTEWWTSFARDGVPKEMQGFKWLPSNSTSVFAVFNNKNLTFSQGTPFYFDRYSLWDAMFPVRSSSNQISSAWALVGMSIFLCVGSIVQSILNR